MSTDTRAALVERLDAVIEVMIAAGWDAESVAAVTDARDALARSAPEERGEGVRYEVYRADNGYWYVYGVLSSGAGRDHRCLTDPEARHLTPDAAWRAALASPPAPVEGTAVDPVCGSQGVDKDGHCVRCGYLVNPRVTEHCPPGFLTPAPVEGSASFSGASDNDNGPSGEDMTQGMRGEHNSAQNDAPAPVEGEQFVSSSCGGETCALCDAPATMKIGEEIMHDDPMPNRHNLTQYVCARHGAAILQPYLFRDDPTCQFCGAAPVEGERPVSMGERAGRLRAAAQSLPEPWAVERVRVELPALLDRLASHPVQGEREGPAIPTARDFGVRLREARVAAGLSLRDAAELLGTTTVRLGCVERGVPERSRQGAGGGGREEAERCRKPGCGALKGRCTDWDCPEGDFVRRLEGLASPAPSAPEEEP